MKNKTFEAIGASTVFTGILGLLVFAPVLVFGFGWLGGWILKLVFGATVTNTMNLMFGTAIMPHQLPLITGTLAVIGSYFKSSHTHNK